MMAEEWKSPIRIHQTSYSKVGKYSFMFVPCFCSRFIGLLAKASTVGRRKLISRHRNGNVLSTAACAGCRHLNMSSIKSLASETQTYSRARKKHNPEKATIVKLLLVLLDPTDKGVYYSLENLIFTSHFLYNWLSQYPICVQLFISFPSEFTFFSKATSFGINNLKLEIRTSGWGPFGPSWLHHSRPSAAQAMWPTQKSKKS